MPFPKPRGATAFVAGLLLVVAGLAVAGAVRRSRVPGMPVASAPPPARAPLLGPRAADEANPTLTFEPQGRRNGSDGAFYVLGVVKNTSSFTVDKPRVSVSLLGRSGEALGRREGYAEHDLLRPGQSSPLKVLVDDPPAHERLAFEVNARRALYDPGAASGLEAELEGEPKANFGTWEISGRVKNTGKAPARLIRVVIVIRNAAGAMIGVESAFTDADKLEPGQNARFGANVLLDEKPVKVELSAVGRPGT